jgi:hypothetical protein
VKGKRLKILRRGTVLEGELPKALQKRGPKWLKSWPKVRLIRQKKTGQDSPRASPPPTKPED